MPNVMFVKTPLQINTCTYIVFVKFMGIKYVNIRHKKSSTTVEDFCELAGTRTQGPPDLQSGYSTKRATNQFFNIYP